MVNDYHSSGTYMPAFREVPPFDGPLAQEERPSRPGGVYLDWGPQIPDSYPVDYIHALVRDPFWVCVYWLLDGPKTERWLRKLGDDTEFVLVLERDGEVRYEYVVARKCPFFWLNVRPGGTYFVRIVVRYGNKLIELCRSSHFTMPKPWVKAPRGEVSPLVEEAMHKFGFASSEIEVLSAYEEGAGSVGRSPVQSHLHDVFCYPTPSSPTGQTHE